MNETYPPLPQYVKDELKSNIREDKIDKSLKDKDFVTEYFTPRLKLSDDKKTAIIDQVTHDSEILDVFVDIKKKRKANRRKTAFSARERKKLNMFNIKDCSKNYNSYVGLNSLWNDYINDVLDLDRHTGETPLDNKGKRLLAEALLKADFHGAVFTVHRSLCSSLVGVTGIVLQEMKNALKIITEDNKLKIVPKKNSVFKVKVGAFTATIYGNNFLYNGYERSAKKFKTKHFIDL